MAVELADAYVSITASARGLTKSITSEFDGVDDIGRNAGDRTSKGFMGSFGAGLGGLAVAVGGAFAAIGVGSFLKGTIDAASDLNETTSKVGIIFGAAAADVFDFAKTSATALGQSKQQALDAASTFATFGKAAGLTGKDLSGFSTGLVTTSADMASFFNTSPEEAIEAIGAALRGESEPIRKYGVLLDDATLRNRALSMGLIATTKDALTPQQKALAAQAEILAQTGDAQGDFARTSDGLANKQKILSAQFTDVKTKIGEGLMPVMSSIVGFISARMLPAFTVLGDKVGPIFDKIGPAAQDLWDKIRQIDFKAIFDGVVEFVTPLIGPIKDLATNGFELLKTVAVTIFDLFKNNRETLATVATVVRDSLAVAFEVAAVAVAAITVVFGFLADHMTLVKAVAIPLLAVLIAYKTINAASAAVGTLSTSMKAANVAMTGFRLTAQYNGISMARLAASSIATKGPLGEMGKAFGIVKTGAVGVGGAISSAATAMAGFAKSAALATAAAIKQAAIWVAQRVAAVAHSVAMLAAAAATGVMTAAQWLLNLAMSANPIGLIVIGIAALIAGIVLAYHNFDSFRAIVDAVWQAIQVAFSAVIGFFAALPGKVLGFFDLIWESIKGGITEAVDWISDRIGDIVGFFTSLPGRVIGAIDALWERIKAGITAVNVWVADKVNGIVSFIVGIPGRVAHMASSAFDGLRDGIQSVRDFVGTKVGEVIGFFTGLPGQISSAARGMWDGISNAFRNMVNGIASIWNNTVGRLSFAIPSWVPGVGGQGFDVPDIPRLSAGGVFSAATYAVIGENSSRSNPEIAAPQSAIRDAVQDALHGFRGGSVTVNATTMADAYDIAREVAWAQKTAGV